MSSQIVNNIPVTTNSVTTITGVTGNPDFKIAATNITLTSSGAKTNTDVVKSLQSGSLLGGSPNTFVIQTGDSKIILAGTFTRYSGITYTQNFGLLRLNTDSSLDSTFISANISSGGAPNSVIVQPDGKIVVGGLFSSYSGVTKNNIVRLTSTGLIDSSFVIGTGFNGQVNVVARQTDGKLVVGGSFTSYSGFSTTSIIRLNTNGTIDNTFHTGGGFDSDVFSIVVQPDGKILVGGVFTTYSGFTSTGIIRLNTNGTVDSTFQTGGGFDSNVIAIKLQTDNKIYVTGSFTNYSGITVQSVIRLNTNGHLDTTFTINGTSGFGSMVAGIDLATNKLWFDDGNQVRRLNTNGTDDTFISYAGSNLTTIFIDSSSNLFLGGAFSITNGTGLNVGFAKYNSSLIITPNYFTVQSLGFDSNGVSTVVVNGTKIYAGGSFTSYNNDTTKHNLVRLNSDFSVDNSFNIGTNFNNGVNILAVDSSNNVIVGGAFTTFTGSTNNRIIRLTTTGQKDTTFAVGTAFNNNVSAVVIDSNSKILVGGSFTTFTGGTQNRFIRLNSNGSKDSTLNIGTGFNNGVLAIAIQNDGKIVVGGQFTTFTGTTQNRLIRLNSNGTKDTTFSIGNGFNSVGNTVRAIAIQSDGKIIIGGSFSAYSGVTANRIVRLNTNGSVDSTFNIGGSGFDNTVNYVSIDSSGKILIGGSFSNYNGVSKNKFVRLNSDGTVDVTFTNTNGFNNNVNSIALDATGSIYAGGIFSTYNTTPVSGLAKFLPIFANFIIDNQSGLLYNADYSANYVSRSLIDFNYANTVIKPTAANGLSKSGTLIKLGGSLTGNTNVGIGGNILSITGNTGTLNFKANTVNLAGVSSTGGTKTQLQLTNLSAKFTDSRTGTTAVGMEYGADYSANYSTRSLVDRGYVDYRSGTGTTPTTNFSYVTNFGNIDNSFQYPVTGISGNILVITPQADDKLLIGGTFVTYTGTSQNHLVRLNANGRKDTSFNIGSGFNDNVRAVIYQTDGKLLVAGDFTTFTGSTNNRIIRLNSNGTKDTSFNVGTGFNNSVFAMALQSDGKIVVAGAFTSFSGSTKGKIVRLNTNGTIDATFNTGTGYSSTILGLGLQSTGKIIVGGAAGTFSGQTVHSITRLNTNGHLDTTFSIGGSSLGNYDSIGIEALAIQADDKILAGGNFFTNLPSGSIRFNADGTRDTNFANGGFGITGDVFTILVQPSGKILVGGDFSTYSGYPSKYLVSLNSNGTIDTNFLNHGFSTLSAVLALGRQSTNKIILGGSFSTYSGQTHNRLVRVHNNGYFTSNNAIINYNIDDTEYFQKYSLIDKNFVTGTTYLTGVTTDIKIVTAGKGLYVKQGTNATFGRITLTGGTAVVSTTKITSISNVQLSTQSLGTVTAPKAIAVTARTAGTSFTITSADNTDTSVIAWWIVEPA